MMDPWIDYNFSIDLVSATQYHYDFLQLVDFVYPQLYIEEVVLKAVKRYERCWMVLKSTHPSKQLIPPIDVHWIWHVHMLSEQSYANDCTKLNSKSSLVDRPFAPLSPEIFQQVEAETRSLWLALFPQEPYDFEMTLGSPLDTEYKQISGMNFVEAIAKQREFNYQVSFPHFKSTQFLKKAAQRYRKFLYLQQKHSEKRLSPTCDIELIWQTHKTHPHAYATDLLANLGSEMFKTISSSTNELAKDTVELWKETFGETLLAPGCLHRSYPSQKGLSCYVPTKRWNDFDAIYSLASVRVERLPTDKEALQVCLFTEDFNGSRTDFGVLKMTRNCGDQFEETRPNLIIRPAVLGAPLHLEITPMAHRGMITSIMGRKKSSVVYRSSCNVRDLLPRSMLGCNNSVTLPIFTTTGDITDAYLKLNSAAKSVAEFDVVFGNFVDTTMTESGTPQLYTQCLHASLNQQWFRANPTASVSDHM